MPSRFAFRQVYAGDLELFLRDGEVRAKNHANLQHCHQTSYQEINDRRGTNAFRMPCGGVVNDYVPFYFSPLTSFAYTICQGNVPLRDFEGQNLGVALNEERIFFVCNTDVFAGSNLTVCFSDLALNSNSGSPKIETDLGKLESHVDWSVFDEDPIVARIPEIGYGGVCQYFRSVATPAKWHNRSPKRMAEFLVREAVPLQYVSCVVAKSDAMRDNLQAVMDASHWNIPILAKPGCYF